MSGLDWTGLIGKFTDMMTPSFNSAKSPFGKSLTASGILSLISNPDLMEFLSLSSAAGLNAFDELSKFTVKKKDLPKGALKNLTGQYIQVGKGQYADIGQITANKADYAAKAEDFFNQQASASLEKIKATPAFATLAAQSEGKFDDQFMSAFNKTFDPLAAQKLGQVGVGGMGADPMATGKAIADVSLMKTQYLLDKQQQAQEYLKQAAGFPGALSFTPGAMANPQTAGSFVGPLSGISNMLASMNQFNATGQWQQSQAKAGLYQDLFGMAAGAAGGMYTGGQQMSMLDKILSQQGGGYGGGGYWGSGMPSWWNS